MFPSSICADMFAAQPTPQHLQKESYPAPLAHLVSGGTETVWVQSALWLSPTRCLPLLWRLSTEGCFSLTLTSGPGTALHTGPNTTDWFSPPGEASLLSPKPSKPCRDRSQIMFFTSKLDLSPSGSNKVIKNSLASLPLVCFALLTQHYAIYFWITLQTWSKIGL